MKNNIKKIISMILALTMLFVVSVPVFAEENNYSMEVQESTIAEEDSVSAVTASSLPYFSAGTFNTYFIDNFSVSSSTYCSIILAVKGSGTVSISIYKSSSPYTVYLSDTVTANGSGNLWHKTLPAGTYVIRLIGSSGTYSYSTNVYSYY